MRQKHGIGLTVSVILFQLEICENVSCNEIASGMSLQSQNTEMFQMNSFCYHPLKAFVDASYKDIALR